MSEKSDESSAKANFKAGMFSTKGALVQLCQERGLDHEKGQNGKAATLEILRARLFLAEVGAEPDDAMVYELARYLKKGTKDNMMAVLKTFDPATDVDKSMKNHDIALSIARAIVNRDKRLNAEGTQPPMDGLDIVMEDANSLLTDQGVASSPTDHIQPSPLPDPVASRITEIKRAKIGKANRAEAGLQIPPVGASNPSVTALSAFGNTFSNTSSGLDTPQRSRNAGAQSTFLPADGDAGPSFIGTGGQAGGREQAALRLGNSLLDIIVKDDAIVRFLLEHLAATFRQEASREAAANRNDLLKERENNRSMTERIEELEFENNALQLRVEELTESRRAEAERRRGFMAWFRRSMEETQAATTAQGTRFFEIIQRIDELGQAEQA